MRLEMLHEIKVALDVVVACDRVLRLPQYRRFEDEVVVWVSALAQCASRRDNSTALDQQLQKLPDLGGLNRVFTGQARARQDIGEFIKQR